MTGEYTKPGEASTRGLTERYVEPPSAQDYVDAVIAAPSAATLRAMGTRIAALEAALLPLAAHGLEMRSLRMDVAGQPRRRPFRAGGSWLSTPDGPYVMFTEEEHLLALDVVGRERTRLYVAGRAAVRAERAEAADTLESMTESGRKTH